MKTLNLKQIIDETLMDEAKRVIKEQLTLPGESQGGKEMYHITHNNEPVDTFENEEIATKELETYKTDHPDKEFIIKKVKYNSPTELIDKLDKMGEDLEENNTEIKENKQMIKKVKSLAEAIMDAKERGLKECTINGKKYNINESLKLLEEAEINERHIYTSPTKDDDSKEDEIKEYWHFEPEEKDDKEKDDKEKDDKEKDDKEKDVDENELPDALKKYLGKEEPKKEKKPCNECNKKIVKESGKKTIRLKESELISLISKMVTESMGSTKPFEKNPSVKGEIKKSGGNKGVIDPKGKVSEKEPFKGANTGSGSVEDPFEKKPSVKGEIKKTGGGKEVINPKSKVGEQEPFKGKNAGSGTEVDPFEKKPSVKGEIKKVGSGVKNESIPGIEVTKRARKVSGDNSKEYMGDVETKMKKATSFEGNDNPEFPKPIGKGEKMAVNPTDEQAQKIADNRGGGMQDLTYDYEPSDKFKERVKMAIEGDPKMGNSHDAANVVKTNVGSNVVKTAERKKENLKKEKLVGWGHKTVQPMDVKTINESVVEEIKRMKNISGYNKKTQ